ncbi:uncharacterized protein EDB91DRAFT_1144368 [Suillus paluster]|uniref:uncharacterized protein n=1 Tax=Suillus paluster TaxID=48578 RepID=UPI001B85C8E4|nr:uncharacterized protein EDB91DRAFT_1144368 [Suillus paluster]KAG1735617.1 hypothetical protein EDB91DRAFT_1144368 [Suillus paluster]
MSRSARGSIKRGRIPRKASLSTRQHPEVWLPSITPEEDAQMSRPVSIAHQGNTASSEEEITRRRAEEKQKQDWERWGHSGPQPSRLTPSPHMRNSKVAPDAPSTEEGKRKEKEEEIKRKEDEIKRKETLVKKKEEDVRRMEVQADKRAEDLGKREEEVGRRLAEEESRVAQLAQDILRKSEEAKRKEDEVQHKEKEVKRKEKEVRRKEEAAHAKEKEIRRKEEKLARREKELARREEELDSPEDLTNEIQGRPQYPTNCGGFGDIWKCDLAKPSGTVAVGSAFSASSMVPILNMTQVAVKTIRAFQSDDEELVKKKAKVISMPSSMCVK